MATEKDEPTLLADVAARVNDNVTGSVSPQDVRESITDTIVSRGAAARLSHDEAAPPTANALTTTPSQITGFTDSAGLSFASLTPSIPADQITVNIDGLYFVTADLSFDGTTNNVTYIMRLYVGGVAVPGIASVERAPGNNQEVDFGFSSPVQVTAGQVIQVFGEVRSGSDTIDLISGSLSVFRLR